MNEEIAADNVLTRQINKATAPRSFYPILSIAFFRALSVNLMSIGLPNYVIYDLSETSFLAGLTSSIFAVTYALSTFLTGSISDKIGRKNTLAIGIIGCNIIFIFYEFSLPINMILLVRGFEGIVTGCIWPVLIATISDVQAIDDKGDSRMSKYNFSWNAGTIIGAASGAVSVFIIEDNSIIFIVAHLSVLILIPFLFLLKLPTKDELSSIKEVVNSSLQENETDENINRIKKERRLGQLPLIIPTLLISVNAVTLGSIFMLIATKFETNAISSYLVYVMSFTRTTSATMFAHYAVKQTTRRFNNIALFGGLSVSISCMLFGIFLNIPLYIFLIMMIGIGGIITYTSSFKIIIAKNSAEETAKYSGYFEGIIGLVAGLSPFLLGFVADIDFNIAFFIAGVFDLVCILFVIIYLKRNHN